MLCIWCVLHYIYVDITSFENGWQPESDIDGVRIYIHSYVSLIFHRKCHLLIQPVKQLANVSSMQLPLYTLMKHFWCTEFFTYSTRIVSCTISNTFHQLVCDMLGYNQQFGVLPLGMHSYHTTSD